MRVAQSSSSGLVSADELPYSSRACTRSTSRSPATTCAKEAASLMYDPDALAGPALTCSGCGQPGRKRRLPDPSGSHQTCSSKSPASLGVYERAKVDMSHVPSKGSDGIVRTRFARSAAVIFDGFLPPSSPWSADFFSDDLLLSLEGIATSTRPRPIVAVGGVAFPKASRSRTSSFAAEPATAIARPSSTTSGASSLLAMSGAAGSIASGTASGGCGRR